MSAGQVHVIVTKILRKAQEMNSENKKKTGWKQKFLEEMVQYLINVIYLTFFFGIFTNYRRLILANYEIHYDDYWVSLIKALVLGKIIMIGDVLRLGKKFEDKPLIFSTVFKTVAFSLWVALFSVLESAVRGFLHGKGLEGALDEFLGGRLYEFLGGCLVVVFAFIPFFAFRELGRVLGKGKIRDLFFRGRAATESASPGRRQE